MSKIYENRAVIFSDNISEIELTHLPQKTIVVVHDMYDTPKVEGEIVEWSRFKIGYPEYVAEQYVIVGLNRMINPSNRCDMVNDYLQVMTKSIPKISIDTSPFIGEPWRLWFHYSVAFGEFMGVDYSYPIEGEWLRWFYYEVNECRLSSKNLPLFIKNTYSNLDELRTKFNFYEINDIQRKYYRESKKFVFEKHTTPKTLTNSLLKILNKYFSINISVDSYLTSDTFHLPNIGIYRYIVEENIRRQNIYNIFSKNELRKIMGEIPNTRK